jgi:5'-3' exonuclease
MKLSHEGECNYVDLSKWKAKDVESHFLKEFLNMDHVGRIETAILSGNDYNNSIKGIGFKRAIKFLTKYMTMADAIKHLREAKPYSEIVPENYETTTLWTKLIFLLATVYNPITQ